MIDTLQTIAVRIRPLRHAAVVLGVACLAALAYIVFVGPAAGPANRYLVPAIVGFVWALSAWGFIDTFQSVPARADSKQGWFARLKRKLARGWFGLLALVFAASTLAALFLTFKLGAYWLDKYHG